MAVGLGLFCLGLICRLLFVVALLELSPEYRFVSDESKQSVEEAAAAPAPADEASVDDAQVSEAPAAEGPSPQDDAAAEALAEARANVAERVVEEKPSDEVAADEYDEELDGEPDPEPEVAPAGPIEVAEEEDEEIKLDWYILKVQSNRERSIAAALQRKVSIEGIDRLFGEIMVPTEKVTEFKNGKKKIVERKLWPGYIAVQMHVCDDTWFAIRETSGIGDFTGSGGAPTPMAPHEVAKILHQEEEETEEAPKLDIPYKQGDKVKVKDGNFESFEGEVSEIDQHNGKVTIMISIFGRSTPVELEYWQIESM